MVQATFALPKSLYTCPSERIQDYEYENHRLNQRLPRVALYAQVLHLCLIFILFPHL